MSNNNITHEFPSLPRGSVLGGALFSPPDKSGGYDFGIVFISHV